MIALNEVHKDAMRLALLVNNMIERSRADRCAHLGTAARRKGVTRGR